MPNIKNFKDKKDTISHIYVATAKEILDECLARAKPSEKNGSIYDGVAEGIAEVLTRMGYIFDTALDGRFISNTQSRIKEHQQSKKETMGFYHTFILRLALFAGIEDYVIFDQKNAPALGMAVLFVKRPFPFFRLIRVPHAGKVSKTDDGWLYTGNDNTKIAGNVIAVNLFIMPGDRDSLWIEVKYSTADGESLVYFANDRPVLKEIYNDDPLIYFFREKIVAK